MGGYVRTSRSKCCVPGTDVSTDVSTRLHARLLCPSPVLLRVLIVCQLRNGHGGCDGRDAEKTTSIPVFDRSNAEMVG
jgi:hypothetical protein